MSVQQELNKIGRKIVDDAKRLAKPNRKSGNLERSLDYEVIYTSDDDYRLVLKEANYGQYLNDKTGYMDKAIEDNLNEGIPNIIDEQTDLILEGLLNKI